MKPYTGPIVAEHDQNQDDQAANIVALRPRFKKPSFGTQARSCRWRRSRRSRFRKALPKPKQCYVVRGRHDSMLFRRRRYRICRSRCKTLCCRVLFIRRTVVEIFRVPVPRRCQTNMCNAKTLLQKSGSPRITYSSNIRMSSERRSLTVCIGKRATPAPRSGSK